MPRQPIALPSRPYRYRGTPPTNIPGDEAMEDLIGGIEAILSDRTLRPVGHGPGGHDAGLVGAAVMQLDVEHLPKLPPGVDEAIDLPLLKGAG